MPCGSSGAHPGGPALRPGRSIGSDKLFNYIQYNIAPLFAAISVVTVYVAFGAVFLIDALTGIEKATSG